MQAGLATSLLDWDSPEVAGLGGFDVILACDVLYERCSIAPVAELVPQLLTASGGRLILADPEDRTKQHRRAL